MSTPIHPTPTRKSTMTHTVNAAPAQVLRSSSISVSSPRVDLYAPIHKALRSFMSDTLDRIGRMDLDDGVDTQRTLAQLDALLTLCHSHVQTENRFMHPAIEARQPRGSKRIAEEHDEHLESIAELQAEVQILRGAAAAAKPGLALRLYRHLALFVAANFQHMHIEETAHNAALWAHYSDAELLQLHGRLLASIDPREMLEVARWMVPALNPAERADLMNGMKNDAPPEAFLGLLAHIRPHLDESAWNKLQRAIGVAP